MTERKRITCPATRHVELIELERTPVGAVVTGCSRFRDGALGCPRDCARGLDRRDRDNTDDRERVLLVLAHLDDDASRIATNIAEELATDGVTVELAELGDSQMPPLEDYDAVVIGARLRLGRYERAVLDYIREQRSVLVTLPAFFFTVGGHGAFEDETYACRMTRRTGWHPTATVAFPHAGPEQRADARAFARLVADDLPAVLA